MVMNFKLKAGQSFRIAIHNVHIQAVRHCRDTEPRVPIPG